MAHGCLRMSEVRTDGDGRGGFIDWLFQPLEVLLDSSAFSERAAHGLALKKSAGASFSFAHHGDSAMASTK